MSYLAGVAMEQGDADGARVYWERARQVWSEAGDRNGVSAATHGLGDLALDARDGEHALGHYVEALDIAGAEDDHELIANCLAGIAAGAAGRGQAAEATQLWAAAQRLDAERGALIHPAERARYERWLGELPAAGGALSTGEALALALELARA